MGLDQDGFRVRSSGLSRPENTPAFEKRLTSVRKLNRTWASQSLMVP